MLATLLLSQGVPMLVAGDECRRTQQGNNNAYCQDNAVSWFDWSLVEKNTDLRRFVQTLIGFRLGNPTLRRTSFLHGGNCNTGVLPDVEWFSPEGTHVDWYAADASLACFFGAPDPARLRESADPSAGGITGDPCHILIFSHAGSDPRSFQFPHPEAIRHLTWRRLLNTAASPPADIFKPATAPVVEVDQPIELSPHSLQCLFAVPTTPASRPRPKRLDAIR
jgi:glycogen operon protein